ncbi:MAG: hypothetical protein IID36_01635 [Planctomycetes bacterium]|nr:hypothetical protein [Planctomycetota bacterium]
MHQGPIPLRPCPFDTGRQSKTENQLTRGDIAPASVDRASALARSRNVDLSSRSPIKPDSHRSEEYRNGQHS